MQKNEIVEIAREVERENAAQMALNRTRRERHELRAHGASLIDNKRLTACGRFIRPDASGVEVVRTDYGRAFYRGTLRCGLIWLCPVCAPFETTRRAFALGQYASLWAERGGGLAMLTLTFRHNAYDTLAETLAALKSAYRRYNGGRAGASWRGLIDVKHSAASTEITRGSNGWHPHLHVLLFRNSTMRVGVYASTLAREHWETAGRSAGIDTSYLAAFDLRTGSASAAEYLAKFGRASASSIEAECVANQRKRGRGGSYTPLQLLARSNGGDKSARAAWIEYAAATRGRNMLVLSRGLRAELDEAKVLRFMDTQIGGRDERGEIVLSLNKSQWRAFMRSPRDERLAVLEAVEAHDTDTAIEILYRNGAYDDG